MKKLHELVSKKQWFLLFNAVTLLALAFAGRLTTSPASVISSVLALVVMNGIAAISAKKYPDWN